MRTSASYSSLIVKGLTSSMFFFSSMWRRVLLVFDWNFCTYRRHKAKAFFARCQSEKYSSLATMDGKDGDTSVAKDTALFHLWIILREAGTWGYFHGCLPHSIFLPEEIWSFDQLRLTEILRPHPSGSIVCRIGLRFHVPPLFHGWFFLNFLYSICYEYVKPFDVIDDVAEDHSTICPENFCSDVYVQLFS